MKELIRKTEVFLAEAEELLAELKTKLQEDNSRVELSALVPGEKFTTGIGNFIVLGHDETGTKVIQDDFFAEDVKFDANGPDYAKSALKKLFDTQILEEYEREFGADNLVEHEVQLKSVDMQNYGTFTCKVRPITFDEAREFNALIVKPELPGWWWTCTPWSTKERGWEYSVTLVSPRGGINGSNCNSRVGVRPFCILKSNIFVSRVEE